MKAIDIGDEHSGKRIRTFTPRGTIGYEGILINYYPVKYKNRYLVGLQFMGQAGHVAVEQWTKVEVI